ncbi:MAG: PQQ-dependent sugar dehydrogenase [Thermoleophilia bacterium]
MPKPSPRRLALPAMIAAAASAAVLAAMPTSPAAAGPPTGFVLRTLASGFIQPTAFAYLPGGDMLVAEKSGRLLVVHNGVNTVFDDLRGIVDSGNDGGLLGLTTDSRGTVYVLFTREATPATPDAGARAQITVMRMRPSAANPLQADPASRVTLLTGPEAAPLNHIGGGLRFDGAGNLLISIGDGSRYQDVDANALRAQSMDSLAGKLLRIDPATGLGVPANPFYDAAAPGSVRSRVIAFGLRNPFRFGVDSLTGAVYVADVGWNDWEELNVVSPETVDPLRTRNLGWPCYEGGPAGELVQPGYANDPATAATCRGVYTPAEGGTGVGGAAPLVALSHNGGAWGSITGGPVYRGTVYPAQYRGAVFLADYARDKFMVYRPGSGLQQFGDTGGWGNPVDIQVTPAGTVAYVAIGTGSVREIASADGNRPPVASGTATPSQATPPATVTFRSTSTDPDGDPITATWNFGDGSAPATGATVTHRYTRRGSFNAVLTASDAKGMADTATVPVDIGNTRPVIRIEAPTTVYRIGDTIPFRITATDAEDGTLTGTRVGWQMLVHHLDHLHYGSLRTGVTGSLEADQHGDNVFYELRATATDSLGGTASASLEFHPDNRTLTLASSPSGVQLVLDGEARDTPHQRPSAVGAQHTVMAPATATLAGVTYTLQGIDLGDGSTLPGTREVFVTPDGPQTVTARYAAASSGASGSTPDGAPPVTPSPSTGTPSTPRSGTAPRTAPKPRLRVRIIGGIVRVNLDLGSAPQGAQVSVEGRVAGGPWRVLRRVRVHAPGIARLDVPRHGATRVRVRFRQAPTGAWRKLSAPLPAG